MKKDLVCHKISFMSTMEQARTQAVEDYCKAIYTLESREDEPVSTNALAERLEITPGSVSASTWTGTVQGRRRLLGWVRGST